MKAHAFLSFLVSLRLHLKAVFLQTVASSTAVPISAVMGPVIALALLHGHPVPPEEAAFF